LFLEAAPGNLMKECRDAGDRLCGRSGSRGFEENSKDVTSNEEIAQLGTISANGDIESASFSPMR
jgi:hypothetical protein